MAPKPPDQDEYVTKAKKSPPQARGVSLVGMIGDSDHDDRRRVYFSAQLNHYAEFRIDDALGYTEVPIDRSPVHGFAVTRVSLKGGARIDFIYSTCDPLPEDQFDLAIRLVGGGVSKLTPTVPESSPPCPARTMERQTDYSTCECEAE